MKHHLQEHVAMGLMVLAAALYSGRAHAEPEELRLTPEQCNELSGIAERSAEMRDVGADVNLYLAALQAKNVDIGRELWAIISQEIEMAFRSPLEPEEVALEVLIRCHRLKGLMGVGA